MIRLNARSRLSICMRNKAEKKHFKWKCSRSVIISRYGKQNKDDCIVHKTTFIMINVRMFVKIHVVCRGMLMKRTHYIICTISLEE